MVEQTTRSSLQEVTIYTDGACSGNPGSGGWGAVILYGKHRLELSGGEAQTTNNRMELYAAIAALQRLKRPCNVALYSDSKYLTDGFNKGWVHKWQRQGWQRMDQYRGSSEPVKNPDLWQELLRLSRVHSLSWNWVRGHADTVENQRCDFLARSYITTVTNDSPAQKGGLA